MAKKTKFKRKRNRLREITPAMRGRKRVRTLSPGLAAAVEAAGGTTAAVAKIVGITPQAVAVWDEIPPVHVRPIEKATGVPREKLRPDLFGR